MADIVLGLASPHAFGGGTPTERLALRQKDETDRRMSYADLLARADRRIADEVADEKMQARYDRSQEGVRRMADILREARPDVLVVVGDDQYEQFHDDNMPMFSVYYGDDLPTQGQRTGRTGSRAWSSPLWEKIREEQRTQDPPRAPAAPELGRHMIRSLIEQDFDIATTNQLDPEAGLGHAFTFVYRKLTPDAPIPMLPVMVNTFFPPNQPTPRRCYALGQALRRAIESWGADQRVAVLASGGLSHVIVDEDIDRRLLDAMVEKDADALRSLPEDRLRLGTSELRNWIIVAGAMEPMDIEVVADYMAMYRTPAGTGNGFALTCWR